MHADGLGQRPVELAVDRHHWERDLGQVELRACGARGRLIPGGGERRALLFLPLGQSLLILFQRNAQVFGAPRPERGGRFIFLRVASFLVLRGFRPPFRIDLLVCPNRRSPP